MVRYQLKFSISRETEPSLWCFRQARAVSGCRTMVFVSRLSWLCMCSSPPHGKILPHVNWHGLCFSKFSLVAACWSCSVPHKWNKITGWWILPVAMWQKIIPHRGIHGQSLHHLKLHSWPILGSWWVSDLLSLIQSGLSCIHRQLLNQF